ncbi:hypothetical protein [Streptomyces sp. MST-110588]|uniref:hypothetical protein n=1 Tax=Streptomyces sp. MST-110588 TaxID=2833628 RepID=UPI001F5DDD8B|nr:hypothetical protein [Streptomyces sp. MST-110588]UNO38799.1 hypothetical protein KGS77_03005 [Streptomyces sp. MST-110588]
MNRHWAAFAVMLRCSLLGHLRNRLAMLLAGAFIPVWIAVTHVCASSRTVRFSLDAADTRIVAQANHIGQVTNALGAVTMVSGFMMFMETFKAGELDRRLVLAGYPRLHMLLAKVVALTLVAALLSLYTTTLLYLTLPVRQLAPWLSRSSAPDSPTEASACCWAHWCAGNWRASSSSSCSACSTPACRTRPSKWSTWPAATPFPCTARTSRR